jgi:hypothetical protein
VRVVVVGGATGSVGTSMHSGVIGDLRRVLTYGVAAIGGLLALVLG